MKKKPVEKLELVKVKNLDQRQTFTVEEAAELLKYEEARGFDNWKLPDDSKYIYDDGRIIAKSAEAANQIAEKSEGTSEGAEEIGTSKPARRNRGGNGGSDADTNKPGAES